MDVTAISPVHSVLSLALPGFRLQEVTDGVSVSEELSVGVKSHSIHASCTLADLWPLWTWWEIPAWADKVSMQVSETKKEQVKVTVNIEGVHATWMTLYAQKCILREVAKSQQVWLLFGNIQSSKCAVAPPVVNLAFISRGKIKRWYTEMK